MTIPTKPPMGQREPRPALDPGYLAKVRELPCVCCGAWPVEAHHCRDTPDFDECGLYERIPGAAMKSSDHDAIPTCPHHHRMFHLHRADFHAEFGMDYMFIAPTRAAVFEDGVK